MAERHRQRGGAAIGGMGIGLDLGQGDRRLGQAAIVMEDRIGAVLPALVGQAVDRLPAIFEEAVAIDVAVFRHPAERGFDVRPQRADEIEIAGAGVIGGGKHDEKRR